VRSLLLRGLTALTLTSSLAIPLTHAVAAPDATCSWAAKTEPDAVNAAFPDTDASYWSHDYQAVPGTELDITGTYAKARYFSFNIYQPTAVPVDSIYDTAAGFFGNEQNAYLSAGINRANGPLVVIRAKAPAFPDTSKGVWPSARDQVRYWSICQNSDSTRVNACSADHRTAVDKRGYFVFVVSDPAQRPANATAKNGVTWIPWGAGDASALLLYRNMAPARSFRQAIQQIDKGEDPQHVMGVYYPEAHYCTKTTFEQRGWRGCFG
jgi:hypothetical protein